MLVYELWEGVSGNMMASFGSEAEALAAVERRATRYGPQSIDSLSLVAVSAVDEDADIIEVASGADLLRRARPQRPGLRPGATDSATRSAPLRSAPPGR
jgi:hypothetical protein